MKYHILICILIVIDVYSNVSSSAINNIKFDGLQRVSLETALFYLPFKIGNTISDDVIADSIKILFNTGYFEKISIYNDNNDMIIIKVKERPIINTITYQGNKAINQNIIQQILNSKKINIGEPYNNNSIFEAKNMLQNMYYDIGKLNSSVKIIPINLPKNLIDLQIIFTEGKIATIDQINIYGNHAFSKKQLLKQFKLYNGFLWRKIWKYNRYHKQKLLFDLETLRAFYLNRGYAKFCINDVRVDFEPKNNSICCSIYITEGYRYSIISAVMRGNVLIRVPEITKYLQIYSGELYNYDKITRIKSNIYYVLGRYGYIQPIVSIEHNFDDDKKTVRLYVYVDTNARSYVREIRFEGNNITKDLVIRRELQQLEQDPLNYICVLKDQEKLRRFSYFKTVDMYIEKAECSKLNQVNIIYKIEERNTGNLNCSLGFGSESGINVQIGLIQENLLGSGDSVSMLVTKNNYQTYIDMLILKRYVGIHKIDITGKIFYNNSRANKSESLNYNTKNYGASINYGYPINDYLVYSIGIDYISNHLNRIEPQVAVWRYFSSIGVNFNKMLIEDWNINSNINFRADDFALISKWTFNNLDQKYFPEFGSCISITSKLTLPKSRNQYYKIEFDNSHYFPLNFIDHWIVMSNLFTGYARGFYNQENPFYDNFYLGGISTVRGFKTNNIGPKAVYYNCNTVDQSCVHCIIKNSQDSIGGNAIIYIRNELIMPKSWISALFRYSDVIRISLFVDAGSIWDTYWKNTKITRAAGIMDYGDIGHIRISSGISLKFISPIGPIILSYSKLLQKYPGDFTEPFQFSIGKFWN